MAIATERRPVELAPAARERIAVGRQATERLLAEGKQVYGLTTGVGAMKRVSVAPRAGRLQPAVVALASHWHGRRRTRGGRAGDPAGPAGRIRPRPLGSARVAGRPDRGGAQRRAGAPRPHGRFARPVGPGAAGRHRRGAHRRGSGLPSSTGSGSSRGGPTPRRRLRSSTQTRSPWAPPRWHWRPSTAFVSFDQAAALTFEGCSETSRRSTRRWPRPARCRGWRIDRAAAGAAGQRHRCSRAASIASSRIRSPCGWCRRPTPPAGLRSATPATLVEAELVASHDNPLHHSRRAGALER